jgi:hypothetical protein
MASDHLIFAGLDLSSGRKPVTFAVLDEDMNVTARHEGTASEILAGVQDHQNLWLAANVSLPKQRRELYADLKNELVKAGFKPFSQRGSPKLWLETDAQECFRVLGGHSLLPRRTLEGRLQRCAILYEQGVRVRDPIDLFEEITRYKLVQGIMPLENLPSSKELDALVAAYFAWMVVRRPGRMVVQGEFVLPAQE